MLRKTKLDDLLKDFEEKSKKATSSYRSLWEGDPLDDLYRVDIHIWRKPGMGNSIQTIAGNDISIKTATLSYIQTLINNNLFTKDELIEMISYMDNSVSGK